MKKSTMCVMAAVLMGAMMTACGQKEPVDVGGTPISTESAVQTEAGKEETATTEESKETATAEKPADTPAETPAESKTESKEPEELKTDSPMEESGDGYVDNFAVDSEAAAAFAEKIKEAVAAQDLEALADLTSFPTYVGFPEEGLFVKTREEFIEIGAERIFTQEMLDSIEGADTSNFTPSMAGFAVSKDGKQNIIFGVVEGKLAVTGLNY